MNFLVRKPWDVPEHLHTPVSVYRNRRYHRREFLRSVGMGASGILSASALMGCAKPTDEEIEAAGAVPPPPPNGPQIYPAPRNPTFTYGRPETPKREAAEFTNFYEFSGAKDVWRDVAAFQPQPWSIAVEGLCSNPQTLDIDDVRKNFQFEERAYRHRCVETWAMCVPWTGFPLRDLLKRVEPKPAAKYVALETFFRPKEADQQADDQYPWPYTEGLTLAEAKNELTFIATGIYGEPLPKQHGAPIRLVVPWKYGFKSIKSIVKIVLTDQRPQTFWNTLIPAEYKFEANVDPDVPHPRWSQKNEWMLGTGESYETQIYNGYADHVSSLYQS